MPKIPHLGNFSSTPTLEQLLKLQDSSDETLKWCKYHKGNETPFQKYLPALAHRRSYSDPLCLFSKETESSHYIQPQQNRKTLAPWSLWFTSLKATGNKRGEWHQAHLGLNPKFCYLCFSLKITLYNPEFQVSHLQQICDNHLVDLLNQNEII